MGRSSAARLQSPDVAAKTADAFRQQVALITDEHPELASWFELGGADNNQAHHKAILQTIALAFENLENDPQGAARLRKHANDRGYSIGNSLMNLMPVPQEIHQGGIHDYAMKMGYQLKTGPGKGYEQQGPLVQRLIDSSTGTIEDRIGALDAYFGEAMPALTDHLDDLLTDYYGRQAAKLKAQSVVTDTLDTQASGQMSSPKTMNRDPQEFYENFKERIINDSTNHRQEDNSGQIEQGSRVSSPSENSEKPLIIDSGGGDIILGDAIAKEMRQARGQR